MDEGALGASSREHLALLDMVRAGDAEGARRAARDLMQSLVDFAIETVH